MNVKVIVFEYLERWHEPLVRWYSWRKYNVYYLNRSDAHPPGLIDAKPGIGNGVRHLKLEEPLYVFEDLATEQALQQTNALYEELFQGKSGPINSMVQLFESEDANLAFKKQFLYELNGYFHSHLLNSRIREILPDTKTLVFVPSITTHALPASNYWKAFRSNNNEKQSAINPLEFPWWLRILATGEITRRKLRLGAVCTHTILRSLFWGVRSALSKSKRKSYRFGVAVVAPEREFIDKIRGIGFLLDDKEVRKDNTLFIPIVTLKGEQRLQCEEKGLSVADPSLVPSGATVRQVLVHGVRALVRLVFMPEWVGRVNIYMIKGYLTWSSFQRKYEIEQFITYSDFGFMHIGRNILFKKDRVKTWYYLDSQNSGAWAIDKCGAGRNLNQYWTYLYYDNLIVWSERDIRYFSAHDPRINEYFAVGCLWSEHHKKLRDGDIPCQLGDQLETVGYSPNQKLIAVFDSTYNNLSRTTFQDGVGFALAIERLLEDLPDVFVVWKEKKRAEYYPEDGDFGLVALYARMAAHPRCFFTGPEVSPSEVSAVCDLTISFPFTSTTVEALGAGAKAIYYVPNDIFPGSHFEKIPHLAVRSYPELRETVNTLLHDTSDDEYSQYLQRYVKGPIEAFMDGQALTRFRQLVCGHAMEMTAPNKTNPPENEVGESLTARESRKSPSIQ